MRIHLYLCLLLLTGLALSARAEDDEDIEDDDEDGVVVEEEDDDAEPPREQIFYQRPVPSGRAHFNEPFDTRAEYLTRWFQSKAKKDGADETIAKYDGEWSVEEPVNSPLINDNGLVLKSKAKHHAISSKLHEPFVFKDIPFIAQYEVRFINGMDCGGAYMKLLSKDKNLDLKTFTDKTPYTIMFGPDKCGNDHKLHFIFRHKNPLTGEYEEKHAAKPSGKLDSYFTDRKTHLYTLVIRPDNSYEVKVDNSVVASGDLLSTVTPPVNPPKEIQDPNDKKPADWDDRDKIADPEATKPEDWDESAPAKILDEEAEMPSGWLEDEETLIPDPSAVKPDDWDDDMDGEWEAPRIENPACAGAPGCGKWSQPYIDNPAFKGKWKAPMIDNPAYKGEWKPKIIANPNYFEDKEPFKMTTIDAVGLELWAMTNDIMFDNFIISDNETVVAEWTAQTWEVKNSVEQAAAGGGGWWKSIKSSTEGRPWLWGIYVVVILLPIVLLSICLCPKSGPVKQEDIATRRKRSPTPEKRRSPTPEDIAAHRKKFDDPTPDTIPEEEEEEDEADEEVEAESRDDDVGAGGDVGAVGGEDAEADDESAAGTGNGDCGDQADTDDESAKSEGSPKRSSSPRKRKTRKE